MATSGQIAALVAGGSNRVDSIKTAGATSKTIGGKQVPANVQQFADAKSQVNAAPKGSLVSVTVTNGGNAAQTFVMFDPFGVAANAGGLSNGGNISFTTTFAGNTTYAIFKEFLKGLRLGSVGASFQFSDEGMITSSALKAWNGNLEDYNSKSLTNYLILARDTYANDPKILNLNTVFYLNGFFALSGSIPAGESLTVLLNIPLLQNF